MSNVTKPVPRTINTPKPSASASAHLLAPALAPSKAPAAAWSFADTLMQAHATPKRQMHLRLAPRAGTAAKARSSLAVERGKRELHQSLKTPREYSPRLVARAQSHFLQAHDEHPQSLPPVTGLLAGTQAELAHLRSYVPCDRLRAQRDIVIALNTLVNFLCQGSDPDLATVLGQSHPLLVTRLANRARLVVLDKLVPTLTLLLTAAAYETTGEVRTMALKTLAHLAANQAWAAAPCLASVEAWATHLGKASRDEIAAACQTVRAALGANPKLQPQAHRTALVMTQQAGSDLEKRALCATLLGVTSHGRGRGA